MSALIEDNFSMRGIHFGCRVGVGVRGGRPIDFSSQFIRIKSLYPLTKPVYSFNLQSLVQAKTPGRIHTRRFA